MTVPLWCLFVGAILPYVWAAASTPLRTKEFGHFDLVSPRVQGDHLTERGAWAWGAQKNAWEALAVFLAANFTAVASGVDPTGAWSAAAMVWVVARIAHGVFYIAGMAPMRVLSFLAGIISSLWIFGLAVTA